MNAKQPPKEPTGTIIIDCNKTILGIKRTVLKISPHYQKRNEEFRTSKKKKIKENLNHWLLDSKIIEDFIKQINDDKIRKEGINSDWPAWKYYACEPVVDKRNGLAYLLIFFLDDDNPELIGVITIYPVDK